MNKGCVFFIGNKLSVELQGKIKGEISEGNIHQMNPKVFKKKGGLAQLMQTGRTIEFCLTADVPETELSIVRNCGLPYYFVDNGNIVHSSSFTNVKPNLN